MASSLDQLRQALVKDIEVKVYGQDITFKVRVPDPARFFLNLKMGNPILEALQDAMKIVADKVDKEGKISFKVGGLLGDLSPLVAKAIADSETYNSFVANINKVLNENIIEPKLDKMGGDGLTIEHLPIQAKLAMINEMYGGSGLLNSLTIFRSGSPTTVLTRRKSETVREPSE